MQLAHAFRIYCVTHLFCCPGSVCLACVVACWRRMIFKAMGVRQTSVFLHLKNSFSGTHHNTQKRKHERHRTGLADSQNKHWMSLIVCWRELLITGSGNGLTHLCGVSTFTEIRLRFSVCSFSNKAYSAQEMIFLISERERKSGLLSMPF